MKKLLLIVLTLASGFLSFSQPYDPSKVNKKALALYEQAHQRAQDDNLTLAAGLLLQAIQIDNKYVDAYLSLGAVYGELKNYKTSVEYYEKAFALDSNYTIDYKSSYSAKLAGMGEFEKALAAINDLFAKKPPKNTSSLKTAEYRKRSYEFAVEHEKKNKYSSYVFTPRNLGKSINSAESEYFPSLSLDGNELVFTRRVNGRNEDFYYSMKKDNEWTLSKPLEGELNTPMDESAQNISQDGQWMVFSAKRPDGFGNYDLYISHMTPTGWGTPENLGGTINSDDWDSQPCLSADKRELYFSSRRLGGFGGNDLYVSRLLANGNWSKPENLGTRINTGGSEACPMIHADNQTLYFTSNGLQGYGESDLFYSRKDSLGKWDTPVNLGYPINTISEEGTLFIAGDGKTAYFASDRSDTYGGLDIYSFELREDLRPSKTLWVKGKVYDQKTGKGLPSTVELTALSTRQLISKVKTNEEGVYQITLPVGKDYAFNVNRKGYLFYSDNFLMSNRSPDSTYKKDIPLLPIEKNAAIILKNVFFDVNKSDLKPESQVELDNLVQLLNDNPTLQIEIAGHTDNVGKPADNLVLSNNRAKAVVSYLSSKNIAAQRLTSKGYGETKPIADNKTEEGRATNRRTELRIIGQ